jgi:two-component system, cell cycle sensor histidine kinase and response regulator CckA
VPVAAQALAPQAAVEYELLLWLIALIPAFLLAYHRGWRGASAALALGMAVLSLTQAALVYFDRGVQDWVFMLGVVAVYLGVSVGIGWVTELLHRARDAARAMEAAARDSEARAEDIANRLEAVAQAATGVLGAHGPSALGDVLREACAGVIPMDAFQLQLCDATRRGLLVVHGDAEVFPVEVAAMADDAVVEQRAQLLQVQADEADPAALRSVAHIPIRSDDRVLGVISVGSREPDRYRPEDLRVLDALAASAAGALMNIEMLSAREASDQALRLSEARFRSLVEDASELILILDEHGRVRYESPAVWRLVGHRRSAGERSVFSCLDPEERTSAQERFAGLVGQRSGTLQTELRVQRRDRTWRTLQVLATNLLHDPAVAGVVINARDVTVQKESAEQLRESEHRYRRFFENDLTGDYLADADGRIVECNPRFAEIFRFASAAGAQGHSLYELYAGGLDSLSAQREQLQREGRVESMELQMRALDGAEIHVVTNVIGIFDANGELVQMLGYVFDISEHKRTEEELRHAQKLEAIGQLAGGVAHDFNNMLMAIIGFASLLESSVDPGTDAAGYAMEIQEAAMRAADLTHQLLAFSRRQVLQPRFVDPGLAVSAAEQMLSRLLPESIEVETRLGPMEGTVRVDPTQFQQVLLNLAVNARDAMPEGGRLTITTREVKLTRAEATRLNASLQPGDYVLLSVRDTGHGMDRATLRRVFEPFYTTKEAGRGTGLGLSTVYGIVHQSGGHIWAESEPGIGTSFTILFPRHEPTEADAVEDDVVSISRGGTVLLAEDEDAIRHPMRRALELAGFSVLAASDGEEALRLAEAYGEELDLLVTDAIMPRMGGARLAEELRKRQPNLGVVIVSGYPDRAFGDNGLPEKCVFLQKPVQPRRLVSVMHDVMSGAEVLRHGNFV